MLKSCNREVLPLNSNIPANLDLAQSQKSFEETVTSALALGDVCQWVGRELREREQQIQYPLVIRSTSSNTVRLSPKPGKLNVGLM